MVQRWHYKLGLGHPLSEALYRLSVLNSSRPSSCKCEGSLGKSKLLEVRIQVRKSTYSEAVPGDYKTDLCRPSFGMGRMYP